MPAEKKRLDMCVVERGLAKSRERARALIMAGKILVNDQRVEKPGSRVNDKDTIRVKGKDIPYVSRGGLKIEAALEAFKIDVHDRTCLDVGASTGGFTDCLLQKGARHVFAVDVGYGQLAWQLRQDARVTVIERTNIRNMQYTVINRKVDLITIDVSFISLDIVIPAVVPFMHADTLIVALIKPQFEVGKEQVGKKGVVKDPVLHRQVIERLSSGLGRIGLEVRQVIPSPVLGPKGNREFLAEIIISSSGSG
jgi:23S rRNA (cytidine1920-2'-O)/16S rRNA (cytidine1409-2'-O)-methyltransferase